MPVEKEQTLKVERLREKIEREKEQALKLQKLREKIEKDETDMATRAQLAREEDRVREEREEREERIRKAKKMVGGCLEALDPYALIVFEDIGEEAPDEYLVKGRAYIVRLFPQWADFKIMVNIQTGEIRL